MFPPATRGTRGRKTCVFLDMEDYSIPDGLSPYLVKKKLKTAMFDAGYRCPAEVRACLAADKPWSDELIDEFTCNGIFVDTEYQGYKDQDRLKLILADVLVWGWLSDSPNVLILSKNHQNIEQDPMFSRFRKALENKGCYVVYSNPDALINQSII